MASDMPLMAPPPPASHPSGPMPDIRNQPFTPPAPMPLPNGPNVSMYPPQGIAQANFYPMYPQPYYAPMYYNSPYMGWSNMQPAPYYWYGAR